MELVKTTRRMSLTRAASRDVDGGDRVHTEAEHRVRVASIRVEGGQVADALDLMVAADRDELVEVGDVALHERELAAHVAEKREVGAVVEHDGLMAHLQQVSGDPAPVHAKTPGHENAHPSFSTVTGLFESGPR